MTAKEKPTERVALRLPEATVEIIVSTRRASHSLDRPVAPPAGFEPATVGLEVQPEGVQQGESGLWGSMLSKEFG